MLRVYQKVTLVLSLLLVVAQVQSACSELDQEDSIILWHQEYIENSKKPAEHSDALAQYCNQVLGVFDRAALEEKYQSTQASKDIFLKDAIRDALAGIDSIGNPFVSQITQIGAQDLESLLQDAQQKSTLRIMLSARDEQGNTALFNAHLCREPAIIDRLDAVATESEQLLAKDNPALKQYFETHPYDCCLHGMCDEFICLNRMSQENNDEK